MAGDGGSSSFQGAPAPAAGDLSTSLLIEALNRLNVIERQNIRNATQNETIIATQARAEESRGVLHKRMNEISENVARIDAEVDTLSDLRPIVTMLRDAHIEQSVIRKIVSTVVKNGYARAAGATLAAGGIWHQWETIRDAVLRVLRVKIGGP